MHLLEHEQVGEQGAESRGQDKGSSYLQMRPVNPKHLQSFVYTQHEKKQKKGCGSKSVFGVVIREGHCCESWWLSALTGAF